MRSSRCNVIPSFGSSFVLLVFLGLNAVCTFAQHTVVQDAGSGRKIELDYDAAEKVVQQRTFDADGKLVDKVEYEYLPGYSGPQQTETAYWPDGKVRKGTRLTYDENSNFLGEFVQVFDEAGKQTAGHKLAHNPWDNVYKCADWNVAAQAYKSVECPSGEESAGAEEKPKTFTQVEVATALEAARQTAKAEREGKERLTSLQPGRLPVATATREVAIVLPAEIHPGERVSGTITHDTVKYEGIPELSVTKLDLPLDSGSQALALSLWSFETKGEAPQPADAPITFVVPRDSSGVHFTLRQQGNPDHSMSSAVHFSADSHRTHSSHSFQSAPLCMKDQLCIVRGPFRGNSRETFAAFEKRPAMIVAETEEAAYITVPDSIAPGPHPLFIAQGPKLIALPTVVGEFFVKNDGRELQAQQTLIVVPTLEGPSDLPDELWRSGNFPESNLIRARKLVSGYQIPGKHMRDKEDKEAKEKGERDSEHAPDKIGGEVLLVIRNYTPEQISLRGSKNQMLVFHLSDKSFERGDFKYQLVVEALKTGPVSVKGYAIPFLAPITAQEFDAKPATP